MSPCGRARGLYAFRKAEKRRFCKKLLSRQTISDRDRILPFLMTERKRNENRFGRKTFFRFYFYFLFDFNKFITNKPDGHRARCFPTAAQALHSPRPLRVALSARREPGAPSTRCRHGRCRIRIGRAGRGDGARERARRKSRHGAVWIHAAHCRIAPFEANSRSSTGRSYRIPESWRSHRRQCRCANGERVPFRQDRWRGLRHPHPC